MRTQPTTKAQIIAQLSTTLDAANYLIRQHGYSAFWADVETLRPGLRARLSTAMHQQLFGANDD